MLRNTLQWIFSRISNIFIQENAFEIVVCEKAAILSQPQWVNSFSPGRCGINSELVILKLIWRRDILSISREIVLRWMQQTTFDDKSALVQVMALYREATNQYLSQCWPRSMSPYDNSCSISYTYVRINYSTSFPFTVHPGYYTFGSCFIVLSFGFKVINFMHRSFRVTSLALGQSHDCPSASEATLKDTTR